MKRHLGGFPRCRKTQDATLLFRYARGGATPVSQMAPRNVTSPTPRKHIFLIPSLRSSRTRAEVQKSLSFPSYVIHSCGPCTRNIVSGAIFRGAFNYPGVKHIDPTAGQSPSVSGSWEHFEVVSLNFSPSADGHLAHDGQSNIGTCEANDQKSALLEQIVSSHSV